MLSEEEAKKIINEQIYLENGNHCRYIDIDNVFFDECERFVVAIETILDLYNKEKEKNNYARLEKEALLESCISKDKIEEKIKELKNKYKDEVLTANDYDTNQFVVDCVEVLEELLEE